MKSFEEWFNTPVTDYTPVDIDVDKRHVTFTRDRQSVRIEAKWDGEYIDSFHRLITLLPEGSSLKVKDGILTIYYNHMKCELSPGDVFSVIIGWD